MTGADRFAVLLVGVLNLAFFFFYAPAEGILPWLGAVFSVTWLWALFWTVAPVWAILRLAGWALRSRSVT
jgi:hypothetical protein